MWTAIALSMSQAAGAAAPQKGVLETLGTLPLTLAAVSVVLGFGAKVAFDIYQKVISNRKSQDIERKQTRQVLVDIILDAHYDRRSIAAFLDGSTQRALAKQIDEGPADFRVYFPPFPQDPTWEDYRAIRRNLEIPLMVACDRYFEESRLYKRSYENLSSDAFAALSKERKKGAVSAIAKQGQKTLREINEMVDKMEENAMCQPLLTNIDAQSGIRLKREAIVAEPKG